MVLISCKICDALLSGRSTAAVADTEKPTAVAATNTGANTANPTAPTESYNVKGKQVERYLSTLGVPFEITMSDVARQINTNVKDLVFEDNSMDDNNYDNFMCKVWKREDITVTAQNETFNFTVPLKVWVKVGYKVMGMQLPAQELQFDFNVKFNKTNLVNTTNKLYYNVIFDLYIYNKSQILNLKTQ